MVCLRCKLKHAYWRVRHWIGYDSLFDRLMMMRAQPGDGVWIRGKVKVTLHKDGKILRVIEGYNKWTTMGLNNLRACIMNGGSGTLPMLMVQMAVGTACSDTTFTLVTGSEKATVNTGIVDATGIYTASWIGFAELTNICQAKLVINLCTGSGGTVAHAYYNFVTAFTKPVGVDMSIEWTTTFTTT